MGVELWQACVWPRGTSHCVLGDGQPAGQRAEGGGWHVNAEGGCHLGRERRAVG